MTRGRPDVRHCGAIPFQDRTDPVAKVSGVDHQSSITMFYQIGTRGIHSQCTAASQHERLTLFTLEKGARAL